MQAVQDNNPDMTILTPMEEYLKTEGMALGEARKVGAVLNKVLDGKQLTKQEAKLINAKSSAIQAALLTKFDIDISQYAKPAEVLAALNKKAAEFADVKDKQAAVKESTKTAGKVFRGKEYGNPQAGRGKAEAQEGLGGDRQADVRAPEAGGPGGVSPVDGEHQGEHEQKSAPRGRTRRGVKPGKVSVEKLTPKQRETQSRAASNGFSSVLFKQGERRATARVAPTSAIGTIRIVGAAISRPSNAGKKRAPDCPNGKKSYQKQQEHRAYSPICP